MCGGLLERGLLYQAISLHELALADFAAGMRGLPTAPPPASSSASMLADHASLALRLLLARARVLLLLERYDEAIAEYTGVMPKPYGSAPADDKSAPRAGAISCARRSRASRRVRTGGKLERRARSTPT